MTPYFKSVLTFIFVLVVAATIFGGFSSRNGMIAAGVLSVCAACFVYFISKPRKK